MQTTQGQQSSKQEQFLPLQLAIKYYVKWDCEIQTKTTSNGYFKCLQGQGEVQFTNGNKYKGNFRNGLMNGAGEFIWTNGMKYRGPFVNNAITGVGTYEWKDGSWYKGSLLKGKRHGKGEYFCTKDNSKYAGEWLQGLRHGYGILQFTEDTSYEGQFQHGLRHGKGKMKYPSGNIYEGSWENDKKCGYGVMNWLTQSEKYEGEWKDDLQNGVGTYYWFDGKIQYKIIKNIYKGNWVNGQRHGFGSFFHSNGCRYEGYFEHNQKHGGGLAMDDNGNIKLEFFQKDKLISAIPQINTGFSGKDGNNQMQKKALQQTRTGITPGKMQQTIPSTSSRPAELLPSVPKPQQQQSKPTLANNKSSPKLTQQKRQQFLAPNILSERQSKLQVEENIYLKMFGIPFISENTQKGQQNDKKKSQRFMISEQIANLILRENSHLRQWYKFCSLTSSTTVSNGNNNSKDFYSGATIDSLFKLIKDLKIIDEFTTISKINRQFFYLGWKSTYDVNIPNPKKLKFVQQHFELAKQRVKEKLSTWEREFNNEEVNYSNVEWVHYAHSLQNPQCQTVFEENIDLNLLQDIHNPKKIILYRHFVCYLLRIAYIQTLKYHVLNNNPHSFFQKEFRQHLEKLFKTISILYENVQKEQKGIQSNDNLTYVSKEKATYNISEEFSQLNEDLFIEITKNYRNLHNFLDNTITAKILFQILEKFELLKEPTEKILFLEKIERFMQPQFTKHSLLRKEMKSYFSAIEKVIYTSPYFQRILSYPLIKKEFQELLYLAINRKITSNSRQDAIRKYREVVDKLLTFVKNETQNFKKPLNSKLKIKIPTTDKDILKEKLIKQDIQRQEELRQIQRKNLELKREQIQRAKMEKQDFRWEQEESQQSDEYFD